jgi:hypothetical protein
MNSHGFRFNAVASPGMGVRDDNFHQAFNAQAHKYRDAEQK